MENLSNEETEFLKNFIFNDGIHISTILMDMDLSYKKPFFGDLIKSRLEKFQKIIEFIEELGWIEHTSDWDPYLIIETKNGNRQTENGYTEFIIKENSVLFQPSIDGDDSDEKPFLIPIHHIQKITLSR